MVLGRLSHSNFHTYSFPFPNIFPEHLHSLGSLSQCQVLGNHEIDEAELIYRPI